MKVFCKVDSCQVTPHGNNIKNHYKKNTDLELLDKLNAAVGNAEVDRLWRTADKHTKYLFREEYSMKRYPNWRNYVTVQNQEEDTSDKEGDGDLDRCS